MQRFDSAAGTAIIDVARVDEVAVVRVGGELDISPTPVVDGHIERLLADGVRQIVIDLRDAQFIDSQGVRMLLKYELRSRERRFELGVVAATGQIRRVFETLGVDRLLRLQSDLELLDRPDG
jgi:anti-sigma B factor antagonist